MHGAAGYRQVVQRVSGARVVRVAVGERNRELSRPNGEAVARASDRVGRAGWSAHAQAHMGIGIRHREARVLATVVGRHKGEIGDGHRRGNRRPGRIAAGIGVDCSGAIARVECLDLQGADVIGGDRVFRRVQRHDGGADRSACNLGLDHTANSCGPSGGFKGLECPEHTPQHKDVRVAVACARRGGGFADGGCGGLRHVANFERLASTLQIHCFRHARRLGPGTRGSHAVRGDDHGVVIGRVHARCRVRGARCGALPVLRLDHRIGARERLNAPGRAGVAGRERPVVAPGLA